MTLRDVAKVVQYWQDGAVADLATAHWLYKGRKYVQALFFCHLSIEKTLKALVVRMSRNQAPFTHHLAYLAGKSSLSLSKVQLDFLEEMNRYNLEGRYPEYYAETRKQVTRQSAQQLIRTTEEFLQWCKKAS